MARATSVETQENTTRMAMETVIPMATPMVLRRRTDTPMVIMPTGMGTPMVITPMATATQTAINLPPRVTSSRASSLRLVFSFVPFGVNVAWNSESGNGGLGLGFGSWDGDVRLPISVYTGVGSGVARICMCIFTIDPNVYDNTT